MKYHLAKLTGFDVDACDKTTPEIMRVANQSIIDIANKRDAKEARRVELTSTYTNTATSASMGGVGSHSHSSSTRPATSRIPSATSPFFVPRSTPGGATFYSVIG